MANFIISGQSPPQDAEFYLPAKFLADDTNHHHNSFKLFPTTDLPYDLDSSTNSALSSPLDDSTTESDSSSSDEDDFFAALTRRFALTTTPKLKPEAVTASSPQSTLAGVRSCWSSADGSPNGPSKVASPPATPFSAAEDDTWELIYAAAGQVARLKMASAQNIPKFAQITSPQGRGLLGNPNVRNHHPNSFIQFGAVKPPVPGQQWARQGQMGHFHQIQCQSRVRNGSSGGACGYDNVGSCGGRTAWPQMTRPVPVPGFGPGMGNGSGVKKECAGTGVFLPRRYSNPPEPRKKITGCPNVVLPAKVVQALNLSFEDMNFNGHAQPRFGCGFSPDYEALLARRNALLEQQRRSLRGEGTISHEVRLPQEWTY